MKKIKRLTFLPLLGFAWFLLSTLLVPEARSFTLDVHFVGHGKLKTWTEQDLKKLPQREIFEKSNGGPPSRFRGPTLDQIILSTIEPLSVSDRAKVDLVILKENSGREISIPRSFITKYPVVFDLGKVAPPVQTRPKCTQEELPVQAYFAKEVTSIELAYSKNRFGSVYLKNRSDPSVIRGEKYFVQTCLGCHGSSQHPKGYLAVLKEISNVEKIDSHRKIYGFPNISAKTLRSLKSYLEAYRHENQQSDL